MGDPEGIIAAVGKSNGMSFGKGWVSLTGNYFLAGTNWTSVVARFGETVGIRADGTLWASEERAMGGALSRAKTPERLVKFGGETNWLGVAEDPSYPSLFLLQRDGTLWRWGMNHSASSRERSRPIRSFDPYRLGNNSDWVKMIPGDRSIYLWKRNGEAWVLSRGEHSMGLQGKELEPGTEAVRCESLDKSQWRTLMHHSRFQAGVREDGTLWFGVFPSLGNGQLSFSLDQISEEKDWVNVAIGSGELYALKIDGSLWRWRVGYSSKQANWILAARPVRLGTHNDWVAITSFRGGAVSLAADGSLWHWGYDRDPLLGPSRRPGKLENIFEKQE
jgi:hypothetical protein